MSKDKYPSIFGSYGGYILCLLFFKYFFATRTYLDITHASSSQDIPSHMTRLDQLPESKQLEPQNFSSKWKCSMKKDNKAGVRSPGRLKLCRSVYFWSLLAAPYTICCVTYSTTHNKNVFFSAERSGREEKERCLTKNIPRPSRLGIVLGDNYPTHLELIIWRPSGFFMPYGSKRKKALVTFN